MEDLLDTGRQRGDQQPRGRHQRDPDIALALHLHQHAGAQQQRDAGEHLVADAEQLPQGIDAAQRVDHALVEEVAPHVTHRPVPTRFAGRNSVLPSGLYT